MVVLLNQIIGGADILSGGEKISVEFIRRWKRFLEITVIMPEHGLDLIKTKEGLEVSYITLPSTLADKKYLYLKSSFFIPLILFSWIIQTIRSFIKLLDINIKDNKIFSAGDFFCNTIPPFLLKIRNKNIIWVVFIFHIIDSPFKRKGGCYFLNNLTSYLLQKFSLCLVRKKADKILVLNEEVKNKLINRDFERSKIFVSGAGIDFANIDAITSGVPTRYDVCFMARLSPTKGIFDIPRIWQGIIRSRVGSSLLLIGGGGFKQDVVRLKNLISEYNLEKYIDMVGSKIGEEKYNLMKSCKIFIFPSHEEGFAISILEAMACKLPVVAWDLPVYNVIYKDSIITAPEGNVDIFVKEILNLLSDENLRKTYADRVYNFAKQYDWDIVAQKAYERINN